MGCGLRPCGTRVDVGKSAPSSTAWVTREGKEAWCLWRKSVHHATAPSNLAFFAAAALAAGPTPGGPLVLCSVSFHTPIR